MLSIPPLTRVILPYRSTNRRNRIRVDAISPGPIDTPSYKNLGLTEEQMEEFVTTVPMGRMGDPDETGKAALFLASDDSSYVTGIELFVGGRMAQI